MNKILVALLLMTTSLSMFAAEGFSSLEEQMTGQEFNAAGLNKLSAKELDELNAWIRKHSLATLAAASAQPGGKTSAKAPDNRGMETDDKEKDTSTITSKLIGKFSGWDGQTVFKLENGMIWAQDSKKKFYTEEIENPEVVIKSGMFGSWHLEVEGVDKDVKVKRIQ